MRAFVLGLLVAGVIWWWMGGNGQQAAAGGADPRTAAPAAGDAGAAGGADPRTAAPAAGDAAAGQADVEALLLRAPAGNAAAGEPAAKNATGDAAVPSTPAPQPANAAPRPAIGDLLPRLQERQAAAIAVGWQLVATVPGADVDRRRVLEALQPAAEDFASLLGALGPDNAFLHSAEGRGLAGKAVAAAMALPDAEAVPAGTRLLEVMLRGRIERGDNDARLFVNEAYRQHRIRVDRWLCDPTNVAGARSYTIAKGDSLARIAQRFRKEGLMVEEGTLAVLNRISNPNAIQVGQKLKVPMAPITAVLEKRSFGFAVYVGDQILRLYWVGHGANDRTPVTEFKVGDKQPQPAWTSPEGEVYAYGHPKNILGEFFIKFLHDSYTGFGAHGTTLPETIGTMSSMGCIRMYDADIAELFKILPRGAKVIVRATESLR
jgi:nucleoid-associated protein YgaU